MVADSLVEQVISALAVDAIGAIGHSLLLDAVWIYTDIALLCATGEGLKAKLTLRQPHTEPQALTPTSPQLPWLSCLKAIQLLQWQKRFAGTPCSMW